MNDIPDERRDRLKAIFGTTAPPEIAPEARTGSWTKSKPSSTIPLTRSAAMDGGGGLSAGRTGAESIVDIDPTLVDAAPVMDRLSEGEKGDETFAALVASIRDGGQQVPVLVRPHPEAEGRYQAAYGHRRIAACREIGKPVRAIIRKLSDSALVLAQGRENALRRDLSFIEKARFAASLIEHGFQRGEIVTALAVHKADLSRMVQVAEAVPGWAAQSIGPAAKAGRARWLALAEALSNPEGRAKAREIMASEPYEKAISDERFAMVLDGLTTVPKAGPEMLANAAGTTIATLSTKGNRTTIVLDDKRAPGLADALRATIAAHSARGA